MHNGKQLAWIVAACAALPTVSGDAVGVLGAEIGSVAAPRVVVDHGGQVAQEGQQYLRHQGASIGQAQLGGQPGAQLWQKGRRGAVRQAARQHHEPAGPGGGPCGDARSTSLRRASAASSAGTISLTSSGLTR